jgi:hypothetical protein
MPHDVMDKMLTARKRPASFDKFYEQQKAKMPNRKPVRTQKKHEGTMFAKRNKRLAIAEAGLRNVSIIMEYKKVTTGEKKKYLVNPYSWRTRKLKKGFKRVLFAEDKQDKKQIKMFVVENIGNVVITDQKYRPRWAVEF